MPANSDLQSVVSSRRRVAPMGRFYKETMCEA
jgi:hypothetical protein